LVSSEKAAVASLVVPLPISLMNEKDHARTIGIFPTTVPVPSNAPCVVADPLKETKPPKAAFLVGSALSSHKEGILLVFIIKLLGCEKIIIRRAIPTIKYLAKSANGAEPAPP